MTDDTLLEFFAAQLARISANLKTAPTGSHASGSRRPDMTAQESKMSSRLVNGQ